MKPIRLRVCRIAAGLLLYASGVYCCIQADIGLAPWDALHMGLSLHLPVSYGTASVLVALLLLLVDLLLRQTIGLGTIIDALSVGKAVDLLRWLDLLPQPASALGRLNYLLVGLVLMSIGQWLYMSSALGCGARDGLLVAISRRVRSVPIGAVNTALLVLVVCAAHLLGGPIGPGTLLTVALQGAVMQMIFRMVRFDPRTVRHQSIHDILPRSDSKYRRFARA